MQNSTIFSYWQKFDCLIFWEEFNIGRKNNNKFETNHKYNVSKVFWYLVRLFLTVIGWSIVWRFGSSLRVGSTKQIKRLCYLWLYLLVRSLNPHYRYIVANVMLRLWKWTKVFSGVYISLYGSFTTCLHQIYNFYESHIKHNLLHRQNDVFLILFWAILTYGSQALSNGFLLIFLSVEQHVFKKESHFE